MDMPEPMHPNMPPEIIDTGTAFALLLEAASEQFKTLQAIVRQDLLVVSRSQFEAPSDDTGHFRAQAVIQMALAKEFLFTAVRALRIIEHAPSHLNVPKEQRKAFLALLRPIVSVRDVNEHAYDPANGSRGKSSRPSMHQHESESVILDETSLIILDPNRILMGPLNLASVFEKIEAMRITAGFSALPRGR